MRLDVSGSRLVARIVYDGGATTGKTTNVRRLGAMLSGASRASDGPSIELGGRTMYFDWLTVRAGTICGLPLICEVLSVPGQRELEARRARTLADADAIVHVCDAGRAALGETRANLAWLRRHRPGRAAPVVVIQANKQDQPGALGAGALADELGELVDPSMTITEAIARDGVGVVDTFLAAVRALERTSERPLSLSWPLGRDALEDALAALPVDREWLAELALEEATDLLRPRAAPVPCASVAPPPLPTAGAPTGAVWPAMAGRLVLAELATLEAYRALGATRTDGPTTLEIAGWELHTSPDHRFDDQELAREALVARARDHARVERATQGDAVLVLARAEDGAHWLWAIRPRADQGSKAA